MMTVSDYLELNYHRVVIRDEDGDYVVNIQELPGCLAHGATPDAAFASSLDAMRSWIESRLAAGLAVPLPQAEEKSSGKILLRMPRSLHSRLAQEAKTEDVSLNQYLVSLLSATPRVEPVTNLMSSAMSGWNKIFREAMAPSVWSGHTKLQFSGGSANWNTKICNVFEPRGVVYEIEQENSDPSDSRFYKQANRKRLIPEYKERSCA